MYEFKVRTIDRCYTFNPERIHQVYQQFRGEPVKLVRTGDTIDLRSIKPGESALVMAWEKTGRSGEFRIYLNSYHRIA